MRRECFTTAILAGGRGSRIGGMFKPLINVCGKPMMVKILENTINLGCETIVSVKNYQQVLLLKDTIDMNVRFVIDRDFGFSDILNALITVAYEARYSNILVLPCDTPFLSRKTLENIVNRYESRDYCDALVPLWPNGFIEPLISVYRKDALIRVAGSGYGYRAVRDMYRYMDVCYVNVYEISLNPEVEFMNINSFSDIEKAKEFCKPIHFK